MAGVGTTCTHRPQSCGPPSDISVSLSVSRSSSTRNTACYEGRATLEIMKFGDSLPFILIWISIGLLGTQASKRLQQLEGEINKYLSFSTLTEGHFY